jgi:transposase
MFCGIDWASERHAVCVLDDAGHQATAFEIAHTAEGFDQLLARLRRYRDPATLPVAIERPDGRLVDRLLEAGHPVVAVQPNAIKAWRDAEVLSGAKNDPGDAALIADYLRLRQHRLRVLQPFSAETRALRAVVRTREQPARRLPGRLLARRQGRVRRPGQPDHPRLPGPLPDPGVGRQPGRTPHGRVLDQARLLRPTTRRRAAGPPARRPARADWHRGGRGPP